MPVHDWSFVLLATIDGVVTKTGEDDKAVNNHGPIHAYRLHGCCWREEGEYKGNKRVDESDDVDKKAPSTKLPWSERNRFSGKPFAHHQTNRDEIGREEPRDDQRDDGAEGSRGADVDQG